MQPQTNEDYQKLLSEVIKKQIVVLGPNITLAKARNVKGLSISDDGTVTQIVGNPQDLTQQLVNQFMELSGLIVKKTMEPLLSIHPGMAQTVASQAQGQVIQENQPAPKPLQTSAQTEPKIESNTGSGTS